MKQRLSQLTYTAEVNWKRLTQVGLELAPLGSVSQRCELTLSGLGFLPFWSVKSFIINQNKIKMLDTNWKELPVTEIFLTTSDLKCLPLMSKIISVT